MIPEIQHNLALISDMHIGCQFGLCHPRGAAYTKGPKLDGGGHYDCSRLQKAVWKVWEHYWDEWLPAATDGEPYDLCVVGDAIDGTHHNSTTQWSHNLYDQERHCVEIMQPIVERLKKWNRSLYWIRGTPAHSGESGVCEERIAERLGAVKDLDGRSSRDELWCNVSRGKRKFLVNLMHHIGTTSSAAHEASAVNSELSAMFTDAGRWGRKPPAVIGRAHRHRNIEVSMGAAWGKAIAFTLAAWQLKTPFAFKVAGARVSSPQIGGSLIRISEHGELYTRHLAHEIVQAAR